MFARNIAWMLWALLPVAGLTYHFGPGQRAYTEERARDVLEHARRLELIAEEAQAAAYQQHLVSLAARRAAIASKSNEDAQAAKDAATPEDEAYRAAAGAWRATADKLQEAQGMLSACGSERVALVRISRARALIRAGKIGDGVGDLENMLEGLSAAGQDETALARQAREEMATGYYYGARLMRSAGKPAAAWREVSGWARQNFRYLAETGGDTELEGKSSDLQKNVELVLNLEQSWQEDLIAQPLPKNSPGGRCEGLGVKAGKGKRPPTKRGDARGAGGVGEIDGGW